MTDIQPLDQTIIYLITTIEGLQNDIKELKESNLEPSGKLRIVSKKIDTLDF